MTDKALPKKPINNRFHPVTATSPTEPLIFLIGDKASDVWDWGKGLVWNGIIHKENKSSDYIPLILTKDHLKNINNVKLADKKHEQFIFYECGEVEELEKYELLKNLAFNTNCENYQVLYHSSDDGFTYNKTENLNENNQLKDIASKPNKDMEWLDNLLSKNNLKNEDVPEGFTSYSHYFNKLMDSERCEKFLEWQDGDLKEYHGNYYKFNGKIWEKLDSKKKFTKYITTELKKRNIAYSRPKLESLKGLLEVEIDEINNPNPHLVAFNNTVVSKLTGERLPHAKEYYLMGINDCDYPDKETPTPHYDEVLDWISDSDERKAERIEACIYYNLALPRWEYFFEFNGDGGTGKSTLFNIIHMLVGEHNSACVPLKEFAEKHGLVGLESCSFLYSTDEENFNGETARLKAVISRETIRVEPKNEAKKDVTLNVSYVVLTNGATTFRGLDGDDDGIERRKVIFNLNRKIEAKDRNENMPKLLKKECGAIMWKILNKFKDNPLRAKELLEEQRTSQEALEVKAKADPLLEFAKAFEEVKYTHKAELSKIKGVLKYNCNKPYYNEGKSIALYQAYEAYFNANKFKEKYKMNKPKFEKVIRKVFKKIGIDFKVERHDRFKFTNVKIKGNPVDVFNEWES